MRGNAIKVGMKGIKHKASMLPNDKGIIDKPEPTFGVEIPGIESCGFKVLHKDVSHYRR